ncbi:MAG: hypothetical protein IJ398_06035 [Clostridia bacterium]|nr:hypothetical protein [Clostridia bacterium]
MVEIYREDGTSVVTFTYDAYGNFTEEYGTEANSLEKLIATSTPFRYRGYTYDQETGLYYLNSRYYDPKVGRFISADDIGYLGANGDLQAFNLFAYCSNNPVMYVDPTGKIGIVAGIIALVGLMGGVMFTFTSSEVQTPTEEEIQKAIDAADRATLKTREDKSTIDIAIDTADALSSISSDTKTFFYNRLYERTLDKAKKEGVPTENLMSVSHIAFEFTIHELGYNLGIENCKITDLNVEETFWTMMWRIFQ